LRWDSPSVAEKRAAMECSVEEEELDGDEA
jgi:hypothetical protein